MFSRLTMQIWLTLHCGVDRWATSRLWMAPVRFFRPGYGTTKGGWLSGARFATWDRFETSVPTGLKCGYDSDVIWHMIWYHMMVYSKVTSFTCFDIIVWRVHWIQVEIWICFYTHISTWSKIFLKVYHLKRHSWHCFSHDRWLNNDRRTRCTELHQMVQVLSAVHSDSAPNRMCVIGRHMDPIGNQCNPSPSSSLNTAQTLDVKKQETESVILGDMGWDGTNCPLHRVVFD